MMASNKAPWDRGTASYKCRKCKKEWIRRESTGQPDTCPSCGERGVKPYRFKRKGVSMKLVIPAILVKSTVEPH